MPFLHEQVIEKRDVPSLSKADIVKGLEAAIAAIAENDMDEAAAHIGKFLCDVIEHGSRGLSLWRMDKASHTFNRYRKTLFFLLNV